MSKYRVECDDCSYTRIFDDDDPPEHGPEMWDAESAAVETRDGHQEMTACMSVTIVDVATADTNNGAGDA